MSWERAQQSLRFAWTQPRGRIVFLLTILWPLIVSSLFLWKLVPVVRHAQTMILHYTIYQGIDEVRAWTWVFFLPALWLLMTISAAVVALFHVQEDRYLAYGIWFFLLAWSFPWTVMLFYLALLNLR